jgi:hypothetical protein
MRKPGCLFDGLQVGDRVRFATLVDGNVGTVMHITPAVQGDRRLISIIWDGQTSGASSWWEKSLKKVEDEK